MLFSHENILPFVTIWLLHLGHCTKLNKAEKDEQYMASVLHRIEKKEKKKTHKTVEKWLL